MKLKIIIIHNNMTVKSDSRLLELGCTEDTDVDSKDKRPESQPSNGFPTANSKANTETTIVHFESIVSLCAITAL